ncbi:CaiB/BaiF CoA transferase family protein [Pseudorhodoferax sp.]|uniref:CaiB/BaiF CoA transferase family protein n=1 Tax=Pseudorhodoferax sp. TaxID=1993553 RepID=UPI002DD680CE|nr:CaiB/BaiF CoA-transferase family protein [Pseudorhodoferax sp.]
MNSPAHPDPAARPLLAGIRVLDIGTLLAGPGAATLLGDHGAEVIKVERPDGGDTKRQFGPFDRGESLTFAVEDRNKKSVTLDLHRPEGQEVLRRLAATSDVVVENFRPGTLARWNLGYEALRAVHPGIVLLSVSGFGQTGPNAQRPGYDRIALAYSGLLGITGFPDRPPVRFGTAIADYVTALTGAFAVMSALYHRDALGGAGQHIDLAMYEALFKFSDVMLTAWDKIGLKRERAGNLFFGAAPGDHFRTQSGRYIALAVASDAIFARLCAAMGRPECVQDPRFGSHAERFAHIEAVNAIVAEWIASRPDAQAMQALEAAAIPFSLIYGIEDIVADPHYAARGSIATVQHPVLGALRMPNVVPRFSGAAPQPIAASPALGAHTDTVLHELLGLSQAEIGHLRGAGVI